MTPLNDILASIFGASWRTTLCGLAAMACTGTDVADLLPPQYSKYLHAICAGLIALGLIQSKDKQVSNAPNPGVAAKV